MPLISFADHCRLVLSGRILDSESKAPLSFANIYIEELKDGAISDELGYFRLEALCEGNYTLKISHVGCKPNFLKISLTENVDTVLYLKHNAELLDLIIIEGKRADQQINIGESTLTLNEANTVGAGLSESMESMVGISSIATGNNVKKPAIHGLTGSRISIVSQGIKHQAQQWGSDHAPEISNSDLEEVVVLKGASAIEYGSQTMGGVILLKPQSGLSAPGIKLSALNAFRSNGNAVENRLSSQFNTGGKLKLKGALSYDKKDAGNARNAQRFLDNTGSEEENISYALSRDFKDASLTINYSFYKARLGIFSGAHVGNLSDLQEIIERGYAIAGDSFSYQINKPAQVLNHEKISALYKKDFGDKTHLEFAFARQYNLRQELDQDFDIPAVDFKISTYSFRTSIANSGKHLYLKAGLDGAREKSTYDGFYFIPEFYRNRAGFFVFAKRELGLGVYLSAGARLDYQSQEMFAVRALNGSNIDLEYLVPSYQIGLKKRGKHYSLALLNGLVWRAPGVNELYANGLHHGAARVEKGNTQLQVEKGVNSALDFSLDLGNNLSVSSYSYLNFYENFIYLKPSENPVLTIRGAFPEFVYQQADAVHYGSDFTIAYEKEASYRLDMQMAVLRLKNKALGYLPGLPSDRMSLKFEKFIARNTAGLESVGLQLNHIAQQQNLPNFPEGDGSSYFDALNSAPADYTLINFKLKGLVSLSENIVMNYFISVDNLLDKYYRDYTDNFRFYTGFPGRSFNFGLSINLTKPFKTNQ